MRNFRIGKGRGWGERLTIEECRSSTSNATDQTKAIPRNITRLGEFLGRYLAGIAIGHGATTVQETEI